MSTTWLRDQPQIGYLRLLSKLDAKRHHDRLLRMKMKRNFKKSKLTAQFSCWIIHRLVLKYWHSASIHSHFTLSLRSKKCLPLKKSTTRKINRSHRLTLKFKLHRTPKSCVPRLPKSFKPLSPQGKIVTFEALSATLQFCALPSKM